MANIKFSQFTQKTTLGTVDFLVGYTGAQNIQIDPADLLSDYSQGTGAAGQVTFFSAASTVTGDNNFYWDNTNKRLGIGTTSPSSPLHVYDTSSDRIAVFESNDNKAFIQISDNDTTGYVSSENGLFSLGRNEGVNANNININASNNVGIGTASPSAKLDVQGTIIATGISQLGSSGSNVLLTSSSAGNVGIGTSSPNQKLQVNGSVNADSYKISNTTVLSGSADVYVGSGGGTGRVFLNNTSGIGLALSGANIGIGTTSPASKLSVVSASTDSEDIIYLQNGINTVNEYLGISFTTGVGGSGPHGAIRVYNGPSASDAYMSLLTTTNGGTLTQGLTQNHLGNIGIDTTSPTEKLQVGAGTGNHTVLIQSQTSLYKATTTGTGEAALYLADGNQDWRIQKKNNEDNLTIRNETTGDDVIVINSVTNNVGIGTTSPSAPLGFGKSTYGDVDTEAFYRVKFQDQGGTTNDVGIGQTETGGLGFNVTAGKKYTFSTGTSGTISELSSAGLDVKQGDVEVETSSNGLILKSPDGTRYRVTVANGGTLSVSAV